MMPTIVLRAPQLGDSRILNTNAEIRRTLAGDLSVVSIWPKYKVLQLTFEALSDILKNTFVQLLKDNQGMPLTFVFDEELRTINYTGIITSPVIEFVKKGQGCMWSTSFLFEVLTEG